MGPNSGRALPGGTEHRGIELQAGTPDEAATSLEVLEDRRLLTSATLQPIANVTVPS